MSEPWSQDEASAPRRDIRKRTKSHVQHAICFVKHQIGNTLEVGIACFKVINEAAWSSNHNLDTTLQVTNLASFGDSAINDCILDIRRTSKLVAFLLDLNSKFAGGSNDEDNGSISRLQVWLEREKVRM